MYSKSLKPQILNLQLQEVFYNPASHMADPNDWEMGPSPRAYLSLLIGSVFI